jgi:hypothetical protein
VVEKYRFNALILKHKSSSHRLGAAGKEFRHVPDMFWTLFLALAINPHARIPGSPIGPRVAA